MGQLFFPVFAGLCFGAWPLIMKQSGLHPIMAAFILCVSTLATIVPLMHTSAVWQGVARSAALIAVAAGLLNGFGTIAMQRMLADKTTAVSVGVFVIIIAQMVSTAIGGRVFYSDPLTLKRAAGVCLAVAAVYLLNGK